MDKVTKRRLFLAGAIGALAVAPVTSLLIRKKHIEPSNLPGGIEMPASMIPPDIAHLGKLSLVDVDFEKMPLPESPIPIQSDSVTASVSSDSKYLLLSYSFGTDWKSRLCGAQLTSPGTIGTLQPLKEFAPQSFITSMGSSSELNERNFSYVRRYCQPSDDPLKPCFERLFYCKIENKGDKLTFIPSETEDKQYENNYWVARPNGPESVKKSFGDTERTMNAFHRWSSKHQALFYGGFWGIYRLDSSSEINPRKDIVPHYPLAMYEKNNADGKLYLKGSFLSSNILEDGAGNLRFIEAPYHIEATPQMNPPQKSPLANAFDVIEGNLVTIDGMGKVLEKVPFPSTPNRHRAILTKSHWCYAGLSEGQFFVFASINDPKNYTVLRFPPDVTEDSERKISWGFRLLDILPDGQHLLCARYVIPKFQNTAQDLGLPLVEVGIVALPFALG